MLGRQAKRPGTMHATTAMVKLGFLMMAHS